MNAMSLAVAERHVGRGDGVDALLDRDALAGQGAFLDLQRRRDDHPPVGRDPVAGVDEHDVAGDDLVGGDLVHVAVAPHLGDGLHHLAEGRGGGLGLAFLVVAEPGVEERQQDEADARDVLADQQADDRRADEHDLHVLPVLLEEALPDRHGLRLGQGVRAVLLEPLRRLGRRQAAGRIDLQPARDLLRRQGVPLGVRSGLDGSGSGFGEGRHDFFPFLGSLLDVPAPARLVRALGLDRFGRRTARHLGRGRFAWIAPSERRRDVLQRQVRLDGLARSPCASAA